MPVDLPEGWGTPLVVEGHVVGAVGDEWRERLLEPPSPFVADGARLALDPSLDGVEARSDALARWADDVRRRGSIDGWRDERCAVRDATDAPLAFVERALLRPLGLELRSAMASVWTMRDDGPRIWVARRAWDKPVDPGRLDALVAGGIAGLDDAFGTLVRECGEEAGIDAATASRAVPAGTLELCYACTCDGGAALHRERLTLFELEIPASLVPVAADGEHAEIVAMTPAEALASIDGGDWARDGAQATLDLVARRGWLHRGR